MCDSNQSSRKHCKMKVQAIVFLFGCLAGLISQFHFVKSISIEDLVQF